MINSLQDLAGFLRLEHFNTLYPRPAYGNGVDVAEINQTYSWPAVLNAAMALNDDQLKQVLSFKEPISFHNNSNNGHTSAGAMWTIQYFLEYHGGMSLAERVKKLSAQL